MRKIDISEKAAVRRYKSVFQSVLDNRPSGTRQRLSVALGTNRSFISQIGNPTYEVPIPIQHLEIIFSICHFSPSEKDEFMTYYRAAHPDLDDGVKVERTMRAVTLAVPNFADPRKNRKMDDFLVEMSKYIANLMDDE